MYLHDPLVDISLGTTGAWTAIDLSTQAGYTSRVRAAIIQVINTGTANRAWGLRHGDSTDNRITNITGATNGKQFTAVVGVNASGEIEGYIANVDTDFILKGFLFEDEYQAFVNMPDLSQNTTSSWINTACAVHTGPDTSIGVSLEFTSAGTRICAVRMEGSTDDRRAQVRGQHDWMFTGVDGSELFEQWISVNDADIYFAGYWIAGATFNTNATDLSIGTTAAYADLTALASGAEAGVFELYNISGAAGRYALRKKGQTHDHYYNVNRHAHDITAADSSRIVEHKIPNTNIDCYNIGILFTPATTGTLLSLTVAADAFTGTAHATNDSGRAVATDAQITSLAADPLTIGSLASDQEASGIFRFTGVTVPQGSTIHAAYFRVRAAATYNAAANVVSYHVSMQASDDAPDLTAAADANSGLSASGATAPRLNRPRTTADDGEWVVTAVVADMLYARDVTDSVQEIVNRGGFNSGNAIAAILDTHANTTLGEWQDWDKGSARLDIYYTASGGAPGKGFFLTLMGE